MDTVTLNISDYENEFLSDGETDENDKQNNSDHKKKNQEYKIELEEGEIQDDNDGNGGDSDDGDFNTWETNENFEIPTQDSQSFHKCGVKYVCIIETESPIYDIYIGGDTRTHYGSIWQIPFPDSGKLYPLEMLRQYENFIRNDPFLLSKIPTLENKTLACW